MHHATIPHAHVECISFDASCAECPVCLKSDEVSWIYTIALVLRDATAEIRAVLSGEPAVQFFFFSVFFFHACNN